MADDTTFITRRDIVGAAGTGIASVPASSQASAQS